MMASDQEMSNWTQLLHSSTKLLEQAAPSAQFPPLQRNLDQLEALSKRLKTKTLRSEAPSQSVSAARLLAREGINAEQLARDLNSFELKATKEDVFPAEASSVEEYLQQMHETAMVSAIEEAQKDTIRSFDDYMLGVLQEDWQKEKRDFLQSLSRISALPRDNTSDKSLVPAKTGQKASMVFTPQVSQGPSSNQMLTSHDKPPLERKALAYADVVKNLNSAREHGLSFKPATAFRDAYESLSLEGSHGHRKSVTMPKIWHLIQSLAGENWTLHQNLSRKISLVVGARRHLEWGHEKHLMDTIHSQPVQAALGGAVGNLHKIRAFLRIRLKDYGVLDFDAGDIHRQPPVDTTWQQIYFCLRTGYYSEAISVAQSSRASHQFSPMLMEWVNSSGGILPAEMASMASEECEKMLRLGARVGRTSYDKKKLILHAMMSGSRKQIERLMRDFPTLFSTIEDFLWFKLSAMWDTDHRSPSLVLSDGSAPYSLEDLQNYLNKFEPSYYTKNGKDPLVYPYVLFLSIQLLPAVMHLSREVASEGYDIDAVHVSVVFSDHGMFSHDSASGKRAGLMDPYAEVASMIRHYGSVYLRHGDVETALEYYVQAAATLGGGERSWTRRGDVDRQRQRSLMMWQLLSEILLCDGGIELLLGVRGGGEEGELARFLADLSPVKQFLLDAAHRCLEAGLYDKSVEIYKRAGAFSLALDTINKCLSDAICSISRGRTDGERQTSSLIQTAAEIIESYKYYTEVSMHEREQVIAEETVLRQLQAILGVLKLARSGNHLDSLRELARLPFLPLNPSLPDSSSFELQSLSPHVQACVPGLLGATLSCLDNVTESDGSLRAMRAKIAKFVANNSSKNWTRDLYEKIAQSL